MFDEITASSLVKVDLDGNQLTKSDYSINPAASPSIRRFTRCARMPAACYICTRPTARRWQAAWKDCCR
jgi:hypothetical protein